MTRKMLSSVCMKVVHNMPCLLIKLSEIMPEIQRERKEAAERKKAEEEAERHSLIPINEKFEKLIFNKNNIDCNYDTIGKFHVAILTYFQLVKSMCLHFVSDEHWSMFDDMYDPNMACRHSLDTMKTEYHNDNIPQQDTDFLQQTWKEIEKTKAYWNYDIANYNMSFIM